MYLKNENHILEKMLSVYCKNYKKGEKIKTIQTRIKPNSEKRKGGKKTTQKNLK